MRLGDGDFVAGLEVREADELGLNLIGRRGLNLVNSSAGDGARAHRNQVRRVRGPVEVAGAGRSFGARVVHANRAVAVDFAVIGIFGRRIGREGSFVAVADVANKEIVVSDEGFPFSIRRVTGRVAATTAAAVGTGLGLRRRGSGR